MKNINYCYGHGSIRDIRQLGMAIKRIFKGVRSERVREDNGRIKTYSLKVIKPLTRGESSFITSSDEVEM